MVYWYGSYDDPGNAYSLIPSSKLVPYEVGVTKGYGKIGNALQKKIDENKKLSKNDALFVKGLEELKVDLEKDPKDRHGQITLEIKEFWEFSDEEDEEEEDELESEPPTPEPKVTKKRKKNTGDEDNKEDAKPKKRGRKKGSKNKPKKSKLEESPPTAIDSSSTEKDKTPKVVPMVVEDIGDDDISSHEDKDDLEDVEPPTESDDDDEDYDQEEKPKVAKKKKEKKPPKKKIQKVKAKSEKKRNRDGVKTDKQLRKSEQRRFTQCEIKFTPLIQRLKDALGKQDKEALETLHKELLKNVNEFCASFILVYQMNILLKQSKKIAPDCTYRVKLWQQLKAHYEAIQHECPSGFIPKKREQEERTEQKPPAEVSVPPPPAPSTDDVTTKADSSVPITDKPSISVSAEIIPSPSGLKRRETSESTPSKQSEKKKKFSLGSYMTKPNPNELKQTEKPVRVSSSGQLSRRQDAAPTWMCQASSSLRDNPSDKNRLFGLEFLQQAAPFVPQRDNKTNHDGIAREIEAAIFKWSIGKEGTDKEWLGKYWEKLDDIVAALSGNDGGGTVATMIADGKFRSADEVVSLSENDISSSFEGKPLEEFDTSS